MIGDMPNRKPRSSAKSGAASAPTSATAPLEISVEELRALRMAAQCLEPRWPREALVEVVQAVCGVNAQLYSAMALSLRARVRDLAGEDVETSQVDARRVVRTWCMRGTMHLLAASDVDWMLSAIPPAIVGSGWRWLERRGGLKRERAAAVLDDAYKTLKRHGPMTRPDLMAALARKHGAEIGKAAAGIVWMNGMLGRVAFGPAQGSKPTYVALDDWLGRKVHLSSKPDHVELARRYLRGYGPAGPRDIAAWWGLPLTNARAAWATLAEQGELIELRVEGQPVWLLASESDRLGVVAASPSVRLLPAFDTYLLGYDKRDVAVRPEHQKHVFHGGEVVPVVLVDGCAAGTWHYERRGKQVVIKVTPFAPFSPGVRELIREEAKEMGKFWR